MTLRLWPRSLAARPGGGRAVGLAFVQIAGLAIHGFDRLDIQRLAQARDAAERAVGAYRVVSLTPPWQRDVVLTELRRVPGRTAELRPSPVADLPEMPLPLQRLFRV